MKKTITLLLVLALSLGLLTACGSTEIRSYQDDAETEDIFANALTAYDANTLVATADGTPVYWNEFAYWLAYIGSQIAAPDENGTIDWYAAESAVQQLRAITDNEACVRFSDEQPAIKNIISIYSAVTGKAPYDVEREFEGKGYGDFKLAVGESVADLLGPIQKRQAELLADKEYVDRIIRDNVDHASYLAMKTLRKVQKKLGFPERPR